MLRIACFSGMFTSITASRFPSRRAPFFTAHHGLRSVYPPKLGISLSKRIGQPRKEADTLGLVKIAAFLGARRGRHAASTAPRPLKCRVWPLELHARVSGRASDNWLHWGTAARRARFVAKPLKSGCCVHSDRIRGRFIMPPAKSFPPLAKTLAYKICNCPGRCRETGLWPRLIPFGVVFRYKRVHRPDSPCLPGHARGVPGQLPKFQLAHYSVGDTEKLRARRGMANIRPALALRGYFQPRAKKESGAAWRSDEFGRVPGWRVLP